MVMSLLAAAESRYSSCATIRFAMSSSTGPPMRTMRCEHNRPRHIYFAFTSLWYQQPLRLCLSTYAAACRFLQAADRNAIKRLIYARHLLEELGDDLLEALHDSRVGRRRALAADDQVAHIPAQRRQ